MIYLTDLQGKFIERVNLTDVQKELNKLFLTTKEDSTMSVMNDSELALVIYKQTVILQDYGRWGYDGPHGPGELASVRYKEGTIFDVIEKALDLLEGDEREELIELLKSLPKPE